MSYCLNPLCPDPTNAQNQEAIACASCGLQLLLEQRFRAIKLIGHGGFGRTFLAVDEQEPTKPRCVIKQSMPNLVNDRAQAEALFHQEALRLAELGQHPQIPQLISHCQQENYQYLVQEFVEGQTLAQALRDRGQFSLEEIEHILHSLLPVLEFIHDRGVIHRDIKPENIIRRADGQLVLVDFGAAKQATGTALLKTGTMIGSAEFIAPEQTRGKATYASDLYSLGVTCVHLLTQMSPFDLIDGDNQWVWQDWLKDKISPKLRQCLDKMIAPALNGRFRSAIEVREFLANPEQRQPKTLETFLKSIPISPSEILNSVQRSLQHYLVVIFSAFVLGGTTAAITVSRFGTESNAPMEAEARTYMSAIGRAQQAYYLEKKKFADHLPYLGVGIQKDTENYSYSVLRQIKTPDNLPAVITFATPLRSGLKRYMGITWINRRWFDQKPLKLQNALFSTLCESNTATVPSNVPFSLPSELPIKFRLIDQMKGEQSSVEGLDYEELEAQCPAGYTRVAR